MKFIIVFAFVFRRDIFTTYTLTLTLTVQTSACLQMDLFCSGWNLNLAVPILLYQIHTLLLHVRIMSLNILYVAILVQFNGTFMKLVSGPSHYYISIFIFFSNLPLQFLQNVSKWYILFERITYGIYLCISQSMYKPTLSSCSKNLVKVSVLPVSWECKLHIVITTAVNTIWHTVVTDGL